MNILILVLFFMSLASIGQTPKEQRLEFLKKDLSHIENDHELFHFKAPEDYDHCPNMGYCHVRDKTVHHVLRTNKKTVYDITYEMDSYRRRITPSHSQGSKHLIVSGCSFVFGTGLSSKETLPYFLAKEIPNSFPYNYGLAGSGTNSMTAQTQEFINQKSIPQKDGYMIYTLLNFHVPRSNALAMEREWLWDTPVYEDQGHGFEYQGTFKEAQPIKTWVYHKIQSGLKLFNIKLNFPPLSSRHYTYTCKLIHKARQIYKRRFPKGRFLVYDHPFDDLNSKLMSCLKEEMIEIIPSNLTKKPGDYIEHDGHPSAQLNKRVAKEIAQYLKVNEQSPIESY
ncbi:MAG: hypothetical protein VXV96_16210 [Bdellovibrionota bacterium]|nr:hypothetical protein [Bdellovibrionota bacterium]